MSNYAQIIDNLIAELEQIKFNENDLEPIVKRCEILIKNIYSERPNYLDEFKAIQFKPDKAGGNEAYRLSALHRGIRKVINLLKEISLDVQLNGVKK